jgi:CBS domain containing-hemolysin-like protein
MTPFVVAIAVLVVLGSLLAMAEASVTRVSRARAMALNEQGRRNAALLERIEADPARYLNSLYLTVMFAQNGSAILVAILADRTFGDLGITLVSVGFTLLYFVLVEAMSKTFGVLESDRAALALAPLVVALSRIFSAPVRLLIGLSNVLLPGKGLRSGPFVSQEEIRQMAEVGHESGSIDIEEKELIDSIFEFGEKTARDVMVPRPDMVVISADASPQDALDFAIDEGFSRIPVYDKDPDNIIGVLYEKDLVRALREPGAVRLPADVRTLVREPFFVPETKKVSDLLRDMKRKRMHMAIVVDEHGDVAGLVTLEDILEEIVGEIADEHDEDEPAPIVPLGAERWRVLAKTPIREFNELVDAELPEDEDWQTIGGLVASALGRIPEPGDEVSLGAWRFRVERVDRRRIGTVLVTRTDGSVRASEAR